MAATTISNVFLSVLGQIGQNDMRFSELATNEYQKLGFQCVLKCPWTNKTK